MGQIVIHIIKAIDPDSKKPYFWNQSEEAWMDQKTMATRYDSLTEATRVYQDRLVENIRRSYDLRYDIEVESW